MIKMHNIYPCNKQYTFIPKPCHEFKSAEIMNTRLYHMFESNNLENKKSNASQNNLRITRKLVQ